MKTNKLPVDVFELSANLPPKRIKMLAPVVPKIIPTSLLRLIFSFNKKYEKTSTKIGPVVMIKDALMGVVKFNPSKKKI